jgi:hypothetical protein
MKTLLISDGLSAMRRTISKIISDAMRLFGFLLTVSVILSSCHEKTNGQDSETQKKNPASVASDSLNKPKVNIQVNRRYDDKGNMISFDSTYTSYYSNVKGDTARMDSLMRSFDRYFGGSHSSFFNKEFEPLFFNDSLRYPDFFHDDYFLKRYELNDQYFRSMMNRMDSIKNHFYSQHENDGKDL